MTDVAAIETTMATWSDALDAISHAIEARPALSVLGGVSIEWSGNGEAVLTGFDFETAISVTLGKDLATVSHDSNSVIVDYKELRKVLRALGGKKKTISAELTLKGDGRATITSDGMTIPISTYDDDFPEIPNANKLTMQATVVIDQWSACIAAAAKCAGTDDTLPMLTGIHFATSSDSRGLRVESSDRFIAFAATVPTLREADQIETLIDGRILAKTLKALDRFGADTVNFGAINPDYPNAWRVISSGAITITTRPIDMDFPKMSAILSRHDVMATALVDRAEVHGCVNKCTQIATVKDSGEEGPGLVLAQIVDHGAIEIRPRLADSEADLVRVTPILAAETEGSSHPLRFAGERFSRALGLFSACNTVEIAVREQTPESARPVFITSPDHSAYPADTCVVVMPAREVRTES